MERNKSDLITQKIGKVNPDVFLLQCILRFYVRSSLIVDIGSRVSPLYPRSRHSKEHAVDAFLKKRRMVFIYAG
jgi:hypothetical protein